MLRLSVMLALTCALLGLPPSASIAASQSAATSIRQAVVLPYLQLRPTTASASELATGKLLIANRRLLDPNFAEAVILLLEYSETGAMGVIINHPTTVSLATVLSQVQALKERKDLVYLGGPVGREQILLLARVAQKPEDSKQILSNVYLVSSQTSLQQIVNQNDAALRLRAYAGYAGWSPGQLDAEVARGDWHIQSTDAATVFDTPADQLWPELIRRSEFEWAHNYQSHELAARTLH